MRKWLAGLVATTAVLIGSQAAYAQNARIVGTVKDQTGGAVPGVTVTARNQETGLTRAASSDEAGNYRLPALPPGTYGLTAELASFSSESRPDIVLVIDQTATIDFTLKPASVAETVTVTGESPLVDTTASAVSTSVSNRQIQDLPVASRRWIDLAMLTPGTSQDGIRGFFYRGNVNVGAGGREYSNAFLVDGVNNTWAEMGEARQNFAMDSIREFKVSTSNYKAEYGLATGGLVTVVSKSGSNELHGSGFLFFRDKSLTSIEAFQTARPPYRRYQYGGSLGGPIVKDKTHFFLTYEGTKESQFFTVNTRGIWPQYDGTYKSAQDRWTYMARVDHQLKEGQTLFLRWAAENEYRPIITAGGRIHPTNSFDFAVPRKSAVLGHTWVMGPRAINELRAQYAFAKYEVAPPYSHGDWAPGDFGQDRLNYCTPIFVYPSVQIGGCGNSQMGPESRWQVKNDFSYLVPEWGGQHQLKVGADFSYVPFQFDNMGSPLGSWTFPKDTPYNANDPTTYPTQYTNSLPQYGNTPTKHFSVYVQDDWEPARGLTFNVGLRYDVQIGSFNEDLAGLLGRIQEKLGRDGSYPLPIPWLQGADQRGDHNNFGPRIGFAWDPKPDGMTDFPCAYGLFCDTVDPNVPNRATKQKPYPQFGRVTFIQSSQDNTYKALLLKLEKRMSHRYQFLVSYTLSKAMDRAFTSTAPDSYGFTKVEWPASVDRPTDRRHRLVVSGIVQFPWGVQLSGIGDFRSSLPFAPTTSVDLNGDGYTGDLPSGVAVGSGCRGLNLDAVNAFRTARGLAAVSTVACSAFANVDGRLSKAFLFHTRGHPHRIELIAQLFNVLNRANYNVPSTSLQSALFGQATSLLPNINAPSRQAEMAIRYQVCTERSLAP